MHMADALLSPAVGGTLYAVSAAALAFAVRKVKNSDLEGSKLPLMAVSGAFIFAAQMVNFAIPGTGSSGHLGGGVLLAGLLGGHAALLALAAVLVVQSLFFADGGLLALGANIFNMGVLPCLFVWPLVFKPLLKRGLSRKRVTLAAVVSAVVSLQLGAFAVVLETLASGVAELPFGAFAALMQPVHLAIGLVEGIATAAVLTFVLKARPELLAEALEGNASKGNSSRVKVALAFALLAVMFGGGLSLFASSDPDCLEWSIERTAGTAEFERSGDLHEAARSVQEKTALLPDYEFSTGGGTGAAGLAGAVLTCALAFGAGLVIAAAKRRQKAEP